MNFPTTNENIPSSQKQNDGKNMGTRLTKKHLKLAPSVNSTFLGNVTPYKKQQGQTQVKFLEDLVLLMAKGFFLLNVCENLWMFRLTLKLDPRLVFFSRRTLFNEILPSMVVQSLELHV
jgi:hypothetical protein